MTRNNRYRKTEPQRKPLAWQHFAAAVANGFQPPQGRGRCRECGFHVATQQHRAGCPKERSSAPSASTQKQPHTRRSKQEPTQ